MRLARCLVDLALPLLLGGCFICEYKRGTGERVALVEQFVAQGAAPEALPPAIVSAMQPAMSEGRPALVLRYRVPPLPPETDPGEVTGYFSERLQERRLPWTVPYMTLNGIPAVVGGPPPGATEPPSEFQLTELGLRIVLPKAGETSTEVGWWQFRDSSRMRFTAEVFYLEGKLLDEDPPVFEVAKLVPLGRHGREGSVELPFAPSPEESVAVMARDADSLETLNVLWLSPEDRRRIHSGDYRDQATTDSSDHVVSERAARKRSR